MHLNILSKEQNKIKPLLKSFASDFYLAGGTAVALQIGHRKSIDFDLFSAEELKNRYIENQISRLGFDIDQVFLKNIDEFTANISGVKISFVSFPFDIKVDKDLEEIIKMPNLLALAAMKAYALGRRAKWKDYVDMYFILRDHFSLEIVSNEATKIFGGAFNSRSFREQLIWFKDIDYSESVDFISGKEVKNEEIERFLIKTVKV